MEAPYLLGADAQGPSTLAASALGQQRLAAWWQPVDERPFDDSCQKPCCCAWLYEELRHGRGQKGAGPKQQEGGQKDAGPKYQEGCQKQDGPRHQEGVQKEGSQKEGDPRHEAVGQKAGILYVGLG